MADLQTEVNLKEIIEATLFVSGEGIDVDAFIEKLEISKAEMEKAIKELKKKLSGENGIHLIQYRNKIQLASNPAYADLISSVLNPIRERALTKATMETLSIIAYKQPITRLEIEEIRGVSCDYTIQALSDHNMIEVIGRKDVIGKPLLYGTTDEFLKRFNLTTLEDLPNQEDLLERIRLIHEPEQKSDSLYYDFKLNEEEETPDFLEGEEGVVSISSEQEPEEAKEDLTVQPKKELSDEEIKNVIESLSEEEKPEDDGTIVV